MPNWTLRTLISSPENDAQTRTTKNGACHSPPSAPGWKNNQGNYESRTYWHRAVWGKLATFAATLKKGAYVQLVGELRTRDCEKEYGNKNKFAVKQRMYEVALDAILKLDRAERQKSRRRTSSHLRLSRLRGPRAGDPPWSFPRAIRNQG